MNIYDVVSYLIGPLPLEFQWVYGVSTVFVSIFFIFMLFLPFIILLLCLFRKGR